MDLSRSPFLALLALAPAAAAQSIHVVDDDGGAGVHFTDLPQAVAAATSGDLLLVKSGNYSGFEIEGLSLTVVEDTGHDVTINGHVDVVELAADQRVELIGLSINGAPGGPALTIADCVGAVQLDATDVQAHQNEDGVDVYFSDAVTLSQCTVSAGIFSRAGLVVSSSSVHLFSSSFTGGDGFLYEGFLTQGSPGAFVEFSELFASGCTFQGGRGSAGHNDGGGEGGPLLCAQGGSGGHGLAVNGATASLRDCTGIGGSPGVDAGCGTGNPGAAIFDPGSGIDYLGGSAHGYSLPPVAREGESPVIGLYGAPGEIAIWAFSVTTGPALLDPIGSVIPTNVTLINFGALPASGELQVPLPVPVLPVDVLRLYEQPFYFNATDGFVAGDPRVSVLVDAGY